MQSNPDIKIEGQLEQFRYQVVWHKSHIVSNCHSSKYPGLIMEIILTRNIDYHLMQTFLPSTLYVTLGRIIQDNLLNLELLCKIIIGYLSLYIPPDSVAGRVAIGMTTIMTMTTMFGGVRESVPKVSYITLLDIWMVMCLIFVNLFMFESILVVYLYSNKKKNCSIIVEKVCRILFPIAFIIFSILYWSFID